MPVKIGLVGVIFLAAILGSHAASAQVGQAGQPWPSTQPWPAAQPWPSTQPWPAAQTAAMPAADAPAATPKNWPENWRVTLGPGVAILPEYIGSDAYIPWPMPIIEVNWRDKIFLSADDGLGWNMMHGGNFSLGPMVHYYRGSNDYPNGMDSVDAGGQVGVFANFRFGHWKLDAKALYAFSGSSEGARANVGLSYGTRINKAWKIIVRADADYFNDNEMKTYFGVSPREASGNSATGFRQYTATKGVADVGLGVDIDYQFTNKWSLIAKLKASQLLGNAADSPVSVQDFQGYGGLGLAYRF